MPYLDPCDSIAAQITVAGQTAAARSTLGEISFVFDGFAVGRGGYNPANPVKRVDIDPGSPVLIDQIFPAPGPLNAIQDISFSAVPVSGDWTLQHQGNTTAPIQWDATAVDVQNALNALPSLSTASVTGNYNAGFTVTFEGADGGINQPLLVIPSNFLISVFGSVVASVNHTQYGFFTTLEIFDSIETPTPQTVVVSMRLAQPEANYGLGEIGLWCRIVNSILPSEIGDRFLFLIAHMPIQSKTDRHVYVNRFVIQF